jgi:hypothetical protein
MDGLLTVFLLVLAGVVAWVLLQPPAPELRARLSEWRVRRALKRGLPASHYTVLSNIRLPRAQGCESDVRHDLLVVSPYGIFVITTRHFTGRIEGTAESADWARSLWRSRTMFRNPRHLSRSHIGALSGFLGIDDAKFHSLLVYTGAASFETAMPVDVTPLGGMVPFIQVRTRELLGFDEAERVAGLLQSNRPPMGIQAAAVQLATLRETHGSRFSARQALLALGLMGSLLLAAGSLVHRLAETPGQFPARDPAALASPFVENAPPPRIALPAVAGQKPPRTSPAAEQPAALPAVESIPLASIGGARQRPDLDQRLAWESSLLCAYSVESRRCACYEPQGRKADLAYERCRMLADKSAGLSHP